ncbi:hypothetical protein FGO68_gene4437 [Halteria grandinella]|uniref:Uncharacterized protein n=1 Tax=Halteria grandinella TaxID=5974 RepID=A0A8J8TAC6_HALGN|nr:hypothetical protein FGO68_gene4437 [Halteria grandinella]
MQRTSLMGPPQSLCWAPHPTQNATPSASHNLGAQITNSYEGGSLTGHASAVKPSGGSGNGYDSISNTTRKALVQLVTEQNLSVRKASKILQIKYTTAKALVQKFRNSGNIDRQRARRMTFEDDQKEKFRKDLIKVLPIDVQEDSEDERWGFTSNASGANGISSNNQVHHHQQQGIHQAPSNQAASLVNLQNQMHSQGGAYNHITQNGMLGSSINSVQPNYNCQASPLQAGSYKMTPSPSALVSHQLQASAFGNYQPPRPLFDNLSSNKTGMLDKSAAFSGFQVNAPPQNLMATFQQSQSILPPTTARNHWQTHQNQEFLGDRNQSSIQPNIGTQANGYFAPSNNSKSSIFQTGALQPTQASNFSYFNNQSTSPLPMSNGATQTRCSLHIQSGHINPLVHQNIISNAINEQQHQQMHNHAKGHHNLSSGLFGRFENNGTIHTLPLTQQGATQPSINAASGNLNFTNEIAHKQGQINAQTNQVPFPLSLKNPNPHFQSFEQHIRQTSQRSNPFDSPSILQSDTLPKQVLPQIIRPVPKIATPINYKGAQTCQKKYMPLSSGTNEEKVIEIFNSLPDYILPMVNKKTQSEGILIVPENFEMQKEMQTDREDDVPIKFNFELYRNAAQQPYY